MSDILNESMRRAYLLSVYAGPDGNLSPAYPPEKLVKDYGRIGRLGKRLMEFFPEAGEYIELCELEQAASLREKSVTIGRIATT